MEIPDVQPWGLRHLLPKLNNVPCLRMQKMAKNAPLLAVPGISLTPRKANDKCIMLHAPGPKTLTTLCMHTGKLLMPDLNFGLLFHLIMFM